ncbi:hypothetical protein JAAARDRAFT_692207 [Jaapia argillacea MUCL 33604]|uniref:U3 small nucleolar RNA-associated protein 22 n=1 Tax=Jaapia argillacea MUCL 33604 TaxID=933084 RepID=A0A067PKW9_9AGAM|nr:hypothetical protein JAAARDRAFT_692207 [Jaapia argillacea MUCL 33604]
MSNTLKRKRRAQDAPAPGKRRLVSEPDTGHGTDDQASAENADGMHIDHEGESDANLDDTDEEGEDNRPDDAPQGTRGTKPKKPPTGQLLRDIREATDLFKSSTFKLQIDALLPTVRPKPSRIPPLDLFLHSLYSFLTSLSPIAPQHPLVASRKLLHDSGVAVPFPLPSPTEGTNWTVAFEAPTDVALIGSWPTKCIVKRTDGLPYIVDVAVEMPAALFQEKDYLNGRFFHKRAYYLACIASAIANPKNGLDVDVSYASTAFDPRLTTVIIQSRKDGSPTDFSKLNACIRIIPTLPQLSPLPLHRLSPSHSNVRVSKSSDESSSSTHPPSPLYNTAILLACTPKSHLLALHSVKNLVPAFADALTLLRVWANQRGYGEGSKLCVFGFEGRGSWWGGLLEMLVTGEEHESGMLKSTKRKPLGKGLSSYQLFRAALDFLARHDFEKDSIFTKTTAGHNHPPGEYKANHEAVFVDSSSYVNLLAGVPLSSLDLLKYDALVTLNLLNSGLPSIDPYDEVFLKDHRTVHTRFDAVIRAELSDVKPRKPSLHSSYDHGSWGRAIIASLTSSLRHGLGNRTKAIGVLLPTSELRPPSEAQPNNPSTIYIGLVYDTEHAFRLVDHGPSADDPDATKSQQFREFWGDKAELRRFKDGSIVESVVWEVKSTDERARIPFMVTQHILERQFGIPKGAIKTWQAPFDAVLRLPQSISTLYQDSGIPSGFKSATAAFDGLVRSIKSLEGEIPLSVLNVSPVSDYLRYTSVFSPVAVPTSLFATLPDSARHLPMIEIVLEFEKSGRWPDDLKAIQKIKLAFFERIATALMKSENGTKATVVVGNCVDTPEIQDQARLEIVTPDGWAFSARIWHDREATLLDRIIDEKSHISKRAPQPFDDGKSKERTEALLAREIYTRRFIHGPKHHRVVAALCHKYSAFAGTVRLVKRWLACHWLLRGHISEEVVEILCASVFLQDRKASVDHPSVPGSKERGFSKVVQFLADWEWEQGLFVPLYSAADGSLDNADERQPKVAASASTAWTVTTEEDPGGRMWTTLGPDIVVAHRVRAIAKATWGTLQTMETGHLDVRELFIHPSDDYDVIVQLDQGALPQYFQNITADPEAWARTSKYANIPNSNSGESVEAQPGFDPGQLFHDDLKRIYSDTFKLFWDPCGGDRYGLVWDPSLRNSRPFRALGGFSSTPVPKGEKGKEKSWVILNEQSVLSEIKQLGGGIIKDVIVQH